MVFGNICPQCSRDLGPKQWVGSSRVCSCGWMDSGARDRQEQALEKKTIVAFMVVCMALVIGFGHLVSWGGHAHRIPALKISKILGTLSADGIEAYIQACYDNSKWECVQENYVALYEKTKDVETLARLAHFQIRLNRHDDAMKTHEQYVSNGGQAGEALLRYAILLEEAGQHMKASQLYAQSVDASTERLPVRAMAGLLRTLMHEGRNEEALNRLEAFHKSAGNAKEYFSSEQAELRQLVRRSKRVASRG